MQQCEGFTYVETRCPSRIQPIFALEDASCWQQVLQRLGAARRFTLQLVVVHNPNITGGYNLVVYNPKIVVYWWFIPRY